MIEYILPKRIIYNTCKIENQKFLFTERAMQINNIENDCITLSSGAIVFDFGAEVYGGVRILTFNANESLPITIRFGESVAECMSPLNQKNSVNAHSIKEYIETLLNYSDISVGETGFRFVYIEIPKGNTLVLKNIYAKNQMLSISPKWIYNGGDKAITDIFNVAKRTIDLCCQNGVIWDGIKRDKLVWIGDLYSEMQALLAIYGNVENIKNSLLYQKEIALKGSWCNGIPSYSLWWIICVIDYSIKVKDKKFLISQRDYILGLIEQFNQRIKEDGTLLFDDFFVDLNLFKTENEEPAFRLLSIFAFKKILKICKVLKLEERQISNIIERLNKKQVVDIDSKTVISYKHMAGLTLTEKEKEYLLKDGLENVSTFLGLFYFTAVKDYYGRYKAISLVKEYYGKMIDMGATTFWENFSPSWLENSIKIDEVPCDGKLNFHGDTGDICFKGYRKSLCHGWSSGIVWFIKENC